MAVKGYDPKKKYRTVTILKDGKPTRVSMELSKARALAARRKAAKDGQAVDATTALIPKPYRDYVDPKSIDAAVSSQIAGLNAPLELGKTEAQAQFENNLKASESLNAQTQASLDQLVQNANARTQGFQQIAGQGISALQQADTAAASAVARALGPAMNANVAQVAGDALAPQRAENHAAGVQDVWASTLASGAQRDFFERGKGLSAITQQSFNEGQRQQLNSVLARIAAQMQANVAQRPELVAKAAREEAQFEFERQTAAAALGTEASKMALDQYEAETGRLSVAQRDAANRRSVAQRREASRIAAQTRREAAQAGFSKDVQKRILEARKAIDKMVTQMRKPTKTIVNDDGTVMQVKPTREEVFGKGNGPWQEAFSRLTSPEIGMDANKAALWATSWFKSSLEGKDFRMVHRLLRNRGVTGEAYKRLIQLAAERPVLGPPVPPGLGDRPAAGGTPKPPKPTASPGIGKTWVLRNVNGQWRWLAVSNYLIRS